MDKRELKAMAETEARLLAMIEGRAQPYITATRERAEREYQAGLEFVRQGGEIRVVGGTMRP
jgi:hypothetical protein